MAQYNITATSASTEQTVSNTTVNVLIDDEESSRPTVGTTVQFPSPAEFETLEKAQKYADTYAMSLNNIHYNDAIDWVGQANLD